MPLYRPSELRRFLSELGASPRKALSQNFLIDGNIIQKTLEAASVQPGDRVLEVGPGPGVLTEALLAQGCHVVAIEKDERFANALERLQTSDRRLKIISGDALATELSVLRESLGGKAKLIANLPYSITTPLITRYAPHWSLFSELAVVVQHEVALRLTAKPGDHACGSISLFLRYYGSPRYAFPIKRSCFYPVPRVDSAMVHIQLKRPPQVESESAFLQLIRTGFAQRRKTLPNALSCFDGERVRQALQEMGVDPRVRAEQLELEQWLTLHKRLTLTRKLPDQCAKKKRRSRKQDRSE